MKYSKILVNLSIAFLISFLFSCEQIKKSTNTLKNSQGAYGEIVLVMDSMQWNESLGEELKTTFQRPFPGLPQAEAYFNLRFIKPVKFDGLLKNHSTIIYVTTLDNKSNSNKRIQKYFSKNSLDQIKEDGDQYIYTRRDEFAKNQLVIHLFGRTEKELIANIQAHSKEIIDLIDQSERDRIQLEVYKGKAEKSLSKYIQDKYGYSLDIPFGYKLAVENDSFQWFSQLGTDLFRNLLIARKKYLSEDDFKPQSIIDWRNSIGKTHLFGSGEEDTVSYMLTDQKYIPVQSEVVDFNGKYAIELRGLWKLKNNTRGGPFVSYAFVDEKTNTMFYVEGFLYAPNKIKRHIVRELEAVLYTFRTHSENNPGS